MVPGCPGNRVNPGRAVSLPGDSWRFRTTVLSFGCTTMPQPGWQKKSRGVGERGFDSGEVDPPPTAPFRAGNPRAGGERVPAILSNAHAKRAHAQGKERSSE